MLIYTNMYISVSSSSMLLKNKSFPNMDHLDVNGGLPESPSSVKVIHPYGNTPMQYNVHFNGWKNDDFQLKMIFFPGFSQNINDGYTLEPPR